MTINILAPENAGLRAIAARQGYELRPGTDDMPIEACRTGSNLLSCNFDTLERLVAWLDKNDVADALREYDAEADARTPLPTSGGVAAFIRRPVPLRPAAVVAPQLHRHV